MSEDGYDDGLVHSHSWATEPPPPVVWAAPAARREVHDPELAAAMARRQDDFDDGLVHSHAWACGERGRPAHG